MDLVMDIMLKTFIILGLVCSSIIAVAITISIVLCVIDEFSRKM